MDPVLVIENYSRDGSVWTENTESARRENSRAWAHTCTEKQNLQNGKSDALVVFGKDEMMFGPTGRTYVPQNISRVGGVSDTNYVSVRER